jgi:hypothetical protein
MCVPLSGCGGKCEGERGDHLKNESGSSAAAAGALPFSCSLPSLTSFPRSSFVRSGHHATSRFGDAPPPPRGKQARTINNCRATRLFFQTLPKLRLALSQTTREARNAARAWNPPPPARCRGRRACLLLPRAGSPIPPTPQQLPRSATSRWTRNSSSSSSSMCSSSMLRPSTPLRSTRSCCSPT